MVLPEPSDTSPPFPLPSSGSFSLSASDSLQTHLSSNSEQRLRRLRRSVTEDLENQPEPDSDDSHDEIENDYNNQTVQRGRRYPIMPPGKAYHGCKTKK